MKDHALICNDANVILCFAASNWQGQLRLTNYSSFWWGSRANLRCPQNIHSDGNVSWPRQRELNNPFDKRARRWLNDDRPMTNSSSFRLLKIEIKITIFSPDLAALLLLSAAEHAQTFHPRPRRLPLVAPSGLGESSHKTTPKELFYYI